MRLILLALAALILNLSGLSPAQAHAQTACPRYLNISETLRNHAFPLIFHPDGERVFAGRQWSDRVGSMALMYRSINEIPQFACWGLRLSPNHLRYVETFGDLVNVIAWGLREAQKVNETRTR